jgi:sugar/nucleoside kinase (ribokinase family)
MNRRGIIAGGNWIIDHLKVVDAWPAQDALASILRQSSGTGGSPCNILIDLARLGAAFPLAAIGLVGDDADGRRLIAACRTHGIDPAQLRMTAAAATSFTDVMIVEGTGRRTFFHQRGANALLGPEHFDFGTTSARIFHLGYLLLLDGLDRLVDGRPRAGEVLQRARAAGLVTSVDCVSEDSRRFQTIVAPVLPEVDVLFANDFEVERITGISLREQGRIVPSAVMRAARDLRRRGVRSWVVIHSPEMACAAGPSGEEVWQPGVQVPAADMAGAAGAGDALAAGVLFGLHEGWPMAESLRLGVAAAASSLYHPTCSEGVKAAQACLELARQLGHQSWPPESTANDRPAK